MQLYNILKKKKKQAQGRTQAKARGTLRLEAGQRNCHGDSVGRNSKVTEQSASHYGQSHPTEHQ